MVWLVVLTLVFLVYMFVQSGQRGTGEFVFLYFREVNNSLLREAPVGSIVGEFPSWSVEESRLNLPSGFPSASPTAELLVVHDIQSYDVPVQSRLNFAATLPITVQTGKRVHWQRGARDELGAVEGRLELAKAGRLPPRTVTISSLSQDGTVCLEAQGQTVDLPPGETWGMARGMTTEGIRTVFYGRQWDRFVESRLTDQHPLTVFTIFNYGRWPGASLTGESGES